MCKYFQTIYKYVSEDNFYDTLDFLRDNQVQNLTFDKNKKIKLKYNNLSSAKPDNNLKIDQQGGNLSGFNNFIVNSEYIANIDEYIDMINKNIKYINFIKINAVKDERGDYKTNDHCAILIVDMKKKSASIQSLNNYKDCLKCEDGSEDFKIGDILMRIILTLCRKEKVNEITLTDNSYFLCNNGNDKIPLKYLRTLTKGEPYYCKFGFRPKYEEDVLIWKNNKKKFLKKPTITKKELMKIILYRKFNDKDVKDKKILTYINDMILPKLQDVNITSNVVKMIMECKNSISCHLLNVIHMNLYYKMEYEEYKNKTFILNLH